MLRAERLDRLPDYSAFYNPNVALLQWDSQNQTSSSKRMLIPISFGPTENSLAIATPGTQTAVPATQTIGMRFRSHGGIPLS